MKPSRKSNILSIRLSDEEWAKLEDAAAGLSYSAYARYCFFGENVTKRRTRGKHPIKDHKLLSWILGQLGRSRIANNLNQLAKAANCGLLILTPDIKAVILEACADIREIRRMLMRALGLRE